MTFKVPTLPTATQKALDGDVQMDAFTHVTRIVNVPPGSVPIGSLPSIPDQRVLGNDSGATAAPTAITVHQELDWVGGASQWIFNGSTHRIDFGDVNDFERTQALTFSAWITATPGTIGGHIITKIGTGANPPSYQFNCTSTFIQLALSDSIASLDLTVNSTTLALTGSRMHIAATYSGNSSSSGVKLYLNGAAVTMTVIGGSVGNSILHNGPLVLGGTDTTGTFQGRLEHCAIFTSELSAAQILEVYGGGAPPDLNNLATAPDPVFWIKLDENDTAAAGGIIDYGTGAHNGTVEGGLTPSGAVGSMLARGTSAWELVPASTSGLPLLTQGPTLVPRFTTLALSALTPVAADTFIGNFTNATAAPTARAGTSVAGNGLTYTTGGTLAVVAAAGGSITVAADSISRSALTGAITASADSNTTAFGTAAAKSVLANATNATAVPAFLAGTAAFQHLRVNSANTALEWAVLSVSAPITLISDTIGFDQTAALGNNARVAVSKNSGATIGTRRRLNLIEGSGVTLTVADDSGNEEVDITITSTGSVADSIVTPTKLAVFGTPANTGVPFVIYVSFAAGAGGSADDVEIFNGTAPFDFRILESWLVTNIAVTSQTVQARTASGGVGSTLSTAMSAHVAGKTSDNSTTTSTVPANGSMFLRRSDSGIGGEFFAMCVREASAVVAFYQASKGINSDWTMVQVPSAIYVSALNKTFVTWCTVGTGGYKAVQVASYNHANNTWSARYIAGNYLLADDDHGHPAICRDSSGFFYIFFGSHATTQPWSISTVADDISAWTQQTALSGAQTYPHVAAIGSVIYAFFRNDAVTTRRQLAIRTATPSGGSATFSALSNIIDFDTDSRVYQGEAFVVGTDIHFVCTRADGSDTVRKGVYYFRYDTTNGSVKNHDASVTVTSGSLPVSLATANTSFRLFDHGAGQGEVPSLCFDTSGDPHIIFADNAGGGTYTLKHIKRTSGTWSSTTNVDTIFDLAPGAGFTTIYGLTAGASDAVEAWYINSSGNKMRRVRNSSGVWANVETILPAGSLKLMGQQAVRDALPAFRTIFSEVSNSSLDSAAVNVKRYGYGDSGPITAAINMTTQDTLFSSVALLLGFEHRDAATTFINDADSAFTVIANGNAQADTAQFKFGTAALLLDGTGDYLTVPDNALFKVSNGDFCVEAFVRRNSSKLQAIAAKRPAVGTADWAVYINASNQLQFQWFSSSALILNITGTTALSSGVWYHVAFTRSGATGRIFLDGVQEANGTESGTAFGGTTDVHIGRDPSNTGRDFDGHIDEFRFTAGNARYTSAFTAPAAAFPRK